MYLKGVPTFKAKLKDAVDARDLKEISSRVHAFKPNWLIMGMRKTGELASNIEKMCADGNETVYDFITVLVEQTDQSVKELEGKV
jgi:HPt (histidine-containing phosphotransfer) domain-containing protein